MKQLVALLCTALFSVFAGVGVVLPKEDTFYFNPATGEADYFQVSEMGEVDYRGLYSSVRGFSGAEVEACDTTPRQDTRDAWEEIPMGGIWQGLYSPIASGKFTSEKLSGRDGIRYTVNVSEDVNITAPAAGTISTSHFSCNYGSTMEYVIRLSDGNVFTVTIDGAKCWFCCAKKTEPENGRYTAATNDSMQGKAMRAGDILCVGKEGTTVTIIHTGT